MKAEQVFEPAGRAALHCAELLAPRINDDAHLAALAAWAGKVAEGLATGLSRRFGARCGGKVVGTALETGAVLRAMLPAGAAPVVLKREGAHPGHEAPALLAAVLPSGLNAALEQLFGGGAVRLPAARASAAGKAARDARATFEPEAAANTASLGTAAVVLRHRLVALLAEVLGTSAPGAQVPWQTDETADPADFLSPETRFAAATIALTGLGPEPVSLHLCLPPDAALNIGGTKSARRSAPGRPDPDGQAAPWGSITVPVQAVLAQAAVPLAQIATLRPGELLSLPLNRRVPLLAGEKVLAHGVPGEQDGRIAVRITTHAPMEERS